MNAPKNIMLLVEGESDKHAFIHLIHRYFDLKPIEGAKEIALEQLNAKIAVKELRGKDNFLTEQDKEDKFLTYLKNSHITHLGVIIDTDLDLSACWKKIKNRIAPWVDSFPAEPEPSGTILLSKDEEKPLGVWLMPDNQKPGELEHLIQTMIPTNDILWGYAQESAQKACELKPSLQKNLLKAKLHTWLAWQEEPGVSFGTALKYNYLDHNVPAVEPFMNWFRKLIELPAPSKY